MLSLRQRPSLMRQGTVKNHLLVKRYVCQATAMEVSGALVRYGSAGPQVALLVGPQCSKPHNTEKAIILIGGLTDGLLYAPYVVTLSEQLSQRGWLVVHASIQSSWQGYGTGNLDRDAADLRLLVRYLHRQRGIRGVVLLGHSTGCQDVVRYVQRYGVNGSEGSGEPDAGAPGEGPAPELLGTILQAPVSDHEWLSMHPELAPVAEAARELVSAGRGEEVVARLQVADGAPITASRLLSLYELGGDDDMFSEGLSREAIQSILSPVGARPCLLLVSGADECVPQSDRIADRALVLQGAIGPAASLSIVAGAPHNLAGYESPSVDVVRNFLEDVCKAV